MLTHDHNNNSSWFLRLHPFAVDFHIYLCLLSEIGARRSSLWCPSLSCPEFSTRPPQLLAHIAPVGHKMSLAATRTASDEQDEKRHSRLLSRAVHHTATHYTRSSSNADWRRKRHRWWSVGRLRLTLISLIDRCSRSIVARRRWIATIRLRLISQMRKLSTQRPSCTETNTVRLVTYVIIVVVVIK